MPRLAIRCLVLAATACLATAIASAAGPVSLGGGATNVDLPPDAQPGLPIKNDTGIPICDLVITVTSGAFDATGAHVSDPNDNSEDWDVDDDQNGSLSTGAGNENSAGAGAEGAGAAALGHADNTQAGGNRTIRAQEAGYDDCIRPGRTASLTLTFSAQPNNGDKIDIQPTNERGANIYAFKDGVLALAEVWKLLDTYISKAFAAFGTAAGSIHQVVLTVDGGVPLWVETEPPSRVDYTDLDGFGGKVVLTFDPPVPGEKGILIEGELSDFGTIHVDGHGVEGEVHEEEPIDATRNPR